jgi:hypothetical protein
MNPRLSENMDQQEHQKSAHKPVTRKFSWYAWLLYRRVRAVSRVVLATLALVITCLFLIIQVPVVQDWLIEQTTSALSKTTQTKVEVGYFRLGFFNDIILKDVYIEDDNRDTLIFAHRLVAKLDLSPITLIRKGLVFDDLSLQKAQVFIRKTPEAQLSNLELLLDRLFPPDDEPKPQKKKKPFRLALRNLNLEEVLFLKNDLHRGQRMHIYVGRSRLRMQDMDLPNKVLNARYLRVRDLRFFIDELPYGPGYEEEQSLTELDELVPQIDSSRLDTSTWKIKVREISLDGSAFQLHNYRRAPKRTIPRDTVDFEHLDVRNINIKIRDFSLANNEFRGRVNRISLDESSGFKLENLSAEEAIVSSTQVSLNGAALVTPYSQIGDTLRFKYRSYDDWGDFPNKVKLDAKFLASRVAMRDIMAFASDLTTNPFFRKNRETTLRLTGNFSGAINDLNANDLSIFLPDGTYLKGKFSSRGLAEKDNELLMLKMDRLHTRIQTLRDLLPNFNLPNNYNKLGNLDYVGSFTGFFNNFTVIGNLRSSIGNADLNLTLEDTDDLERSQYRGTITLNDFDLGKWTDNPNLGKISLTSNIQNGKGLAGKDASVDLGADLISFQFKNYNYQNVKMKGQLKSRKFDGELVFSDPNVELDFSGKVDFSGEVPEYRFRSSINRLDLGKLNLSKQDITLAGDVELDLKASNLADLVGNARFLDFYLHKDDQTYHFEAVNINSELDSLGNRRMKVASELVDADLYGKFDIEKVPAALQNFVAVSYPDFARRLRIKSVDSLSRTQQFRYNIHVKNSGGLHELLSADMGPLENLSLSGNFDNQRRDFNTIIRTPSFRFGSLDFGEVEITSDIANGEGLMNVGAKSTVINGKTKLLPIGLSLFLQKDTVQFYLGYDEEESASMAKVNLEGKFFIRDTSTMLMQLSRTNVSILGSTWSVNDKNSIVFGKDYIDIQDFILLRDDKVISLERLGRKGMQLKMNNMDLAQLNEYLKFEPIQFGGKLEVKVRVEDLLKLNTIGAEITCDTFLMNGDDWGALLVDVSLEDLKHPIHVYTSITKDTSQLIAEGSYNLQAFGESKEQSAGYFDLNLNIQSFPLNIAEYFIGDVLKNIYGYVEADVQFFGTFKDPNIAGKMWLNRGGLTVDFLKTTYTFGKVPVEIDNYLFDMSGGIMRDKDGREAILEGGIRHFFLKNFGFNADLITRGNFLALDTKKGDNSQFYGQALGNGQVSFDGSFQRPDISVTAEVGPGTKIILPVSNQRQANELDFVKFSNNGQQDDKVKTPETELKGVGIDMDITVLRGAEMQVVFNEKSGDVIKGTGRGNLQISVPRGGAFTMFGDITIEDGGYLFTFYNVINKDFRVKPGGTISWTGNPYAAQIDLEAEYRDLNTSVFGLISEYLTGATDDIKALASTSTNVDLLMKLQGELLKPDIKFDIVIPNLRGELQTYTEAKLRALKQDQNELNKQVFGLIVAGQFISSDINVQQGVDFFYNTVSELISNQLSVLVTELFSDLIGEGEVFSDLDFDIGYNQNLSQSINRGQELNFNIKPSFLNDRLTVQMGGNVRSLVSFNNGAVANSAGTFVGTDFIIEYAITKDRNLKLRFFHKLEPDFGGRRNQIGVGLSFRKEYDSFSEFLRGAKSDLRKTAKEEKKAKDKASLDSLRMMNR